ncbi:multiple sugar transport system permease protein [Neorhizobium sp. 2083]|uniref:carbohydrate ABC transporter permease n=1 Tax=Neorhizobium sp. 2083 TaxID=2817762 RepID=UPI00285C45C4|nr:sugar ABC transporter permease [Neorhizobium sp. 2083]MDR6820927.1 multiple sugar transport system permease protein [Neorhizobium sp. 2083]
MDTGSHLPKTGMIGELSETRYWIYLLLLPSLVIILLVIAYPTIYGMAISFREMRLTRPGLTGWVGLKHYLVMIDDPVFWVALKNTVLWVTFAVVLELGLGFIAATALNRNVPGTGIFAVLILVPYFLPNVVAGHMWALLLDPRLGVINDILVGIGILSSYKAWFADPNTALAATIFVEAWHGFPFFALLLLAGLKGIPQDLYKAAAVDGAGPVAQFRLITVPMLKSVIAAAVILRVISLVNSPDLLLILTGGGPGDATQVLSLYAFQTAYKDFNFGYASALSVVMFVILMVFAYAYIRLSKIGQE